VSDGGSIGSDQQPLVHVGITAYRRTTYIREAVESVLAQSFERWQLTISDNGPGGGEIELAVRPYLADPRVSYVPTGRELPLARNWTAALRMGSTPYVAILNDDDRYHPGFLQRRVEALEAHPDCGFAYSEWIGIDDGGAVTTHVPPKFPEGVLPRELMARRFMRQNLVVPPAILVRRSACDAVGAYFDDRWQYCDWDLWARLASRFPAYYFAEPDCDWRRHGEAYTFSERETAEHILSMIESLEALYERELGVELSRVERARNRSQVLLHIAGDAHRAGGWRKSGGLYRGALRQYPPAVFDPTSLSLVGHSLLGARGSRAASRLLRVFRHAGTAQGSAPT
jgi:glycosyltransferase involved in cell wall biosynthesis